MVSMKEKFGYGLGDTASNFIFQLIVNFLGIYYTDVYGLSPVVVGTLFAAVRLMDAFTDPLMGAFCDRFQSRWGKFRPWMLWLSVPFGAATILAFTVPEDSNVIYAYVTYAILMLFYTAVNIPYCALGGVISADPQERVSIQSWRFSLAMVGNIIVSSATMPMVEYFGAGDSKFGFQMAAVVFAIGAVILFTLCFYLTKERIEDKHAKREETVWQDLVALWNNDQWRLLALINLVLLVGVVMRGTMAPYFVKYVLGEESMVLTALLTLGSIGAVIGSMVAGQLSKRGEYLTFIWIALAQVGLLFFFFMLDMIGWELFAMSIIAGVIGTLVSMIIGRYQGKVGSLRIIFLLQGIGHIALFLVGSQNIEASFFFFILVMFLNQVGVPILWSMMADSVDYGQWKTGVRITGMNFSANLFALKIGVTIGGAGVGYILGWYGYVANEVQNSDALFGISLGFALIPGSCGFLIAVISLFYTLTEEKLRNIQAEIGISD